MGRTGTRDESGAIVLGWLTKLAISVVLFGLIAYDGISLVTTNFSAADRANTYANEAVDNFHNTKNIDATFAYMVAEAETHGDTIDGKTFSISATGSCHLTIHHTASTLWMHRLSFLKKYTVATAKGEGTGSS